MRLFARSRFLLAAASLALLGAASAACGDGPDPSYSATVMPGGTPAPTAKPNPYVVSYRPADGAIVQQKDTAAPNADTDPRFGPCFEADYSNLPANLRSFRIYIDRVDRTLEFKWTLPQSNTGDKKPRACFSNAAGLPPGTHTVTVVVRQTENLREEPISQVQWTFEVR